MQFKGHDFSAVGSMAEQFDMLFADKELKLLLLWAIIAPAAGISYIIWLKYPKLRLFALLGFALAIVQFYSQVGAMQAALKGLGLTI